MDIEIRQDANDRSGGRPRTFVTNRDYPAVPRKGDYIDLAEGWCAEGVKDVYWTADGKVVIELRTTVLDDEHMGLLNLGWREL